MNNNSRKIFRIIIGIIWFIGAISFGLRKQYLLSILFVIVGIVFIVNSFKLGKNS
ncbi:hypothetical protein [Clostridium sp. Marseille-Q2269]|uniref:hypothetical protein n=1 Tax=Clostridium sp. Marseille-Q2269 TaxID=2942205 RepID=UPI002073F6FE|nr:hypothetical protein [Clostridium sp. Marseille-Q2269]